jgi:3-phosphoshikimate 1-carboxyvinyltransferase
MPIPEIIEIMPLAGPVRTEVVVPGSKSITNRALVLAALANGRTELRGALWSEDTQVMVECLGQLGFEMRVEHDFEEPCNRTIYVHGLGGRIPRGGTIENPLELHVGNAGTAARFLAPLVCLGRGVYRLAGVPRMHERPQAALFDALRQLGYGICAPGDKLPAIVKGGGALAGRCHVSIVESSQFASGLLLSSRAGGWEIEVTGENEEESPYVAMTERLVGAFPVEGGVFQIEPDASSGSYFLAAGYLNGEVQGSVSVARLPESGWQIDARFEGVYRRIVRGEHGLAVSRRTDLGDSIMTAIVMAPLAAVPVRFTDLGRLRLQECERVAALRTELARCGANVIEEADTLAVFPSKMRGATVETYQDHRMAMSFAILALKVPGIRIKNPACVKKTFPNFFQKLAMAPPVGLGAGILDVESGRRLEVGELFAG